MRGRSKRKDENDDYSCSPLVSLTRPADALAYNVVGVAIIPVPEIFRFGSHAQICASPVCSRFLLLGPKALTNRYPLAGQEVLA